MKNIFLVILTMSLLASCKKDAIPASNSTGPVQINLPVSYMGNCEKHQEGVERDVKWRVYRDEYKGNSIIKYNVDVKTELKTNDMNIASNRYIEDDSFGVPVEIPDKGTYGLRLIVTARECYSCCQGSYCGTGMGEPIWNAQEIRINAGSRPSVLPTTAKRKCE